MGSFSDLLLLENNTDNDLSNKDYKKINFSECLLQIVLCFVTHFYFPKKLRAVDFGSWQLVWWTQATI